MAAMRTIAVLPLFAALIGLAGAQICDDSSVQSTLAFCAEVEQDQLCANQVATESTCELCQLYNTSCGPLEVNNAALCSDAQTVQTCQIARVLNIINCTGDRSVDSYLCDQCEILVTNCASSPPTANTTTNTTNSSYCDAFESQFYCALAEMRQACPGRYNDDICSTCDVWPVLCGGPPQLPDSNTTCAQEDYVAGCLALELLGGDLECTNLGDQETNPDVALQCDVCSVINEQCENPTFNPGNYEECNDTVLAAFCATAFTEQFCPGTKFDNMTCGLCSFVQIVCGPPHGGVDDVCSSAEFREDCSSLELSSVCTMEMIPQDNISSCDICRFINETCIQSSSASGDLDDLCNPNGKLVAFCAAALAEELCPGTKFDEETCNTCSYVEHQCGPLEGSVGDFCKEEVLGEECSEITHICSGMKSNIPQENITSCDACDFFKERCLEDEDNSGHSTYDVALMTTILSPLLGILLQVWHVPTQPGLSLVVEL